MIKDLTDSRIDRQNILNNEIAIAEIQEKSGIEGILWNVKMYVTKEMTADFLMWVLERLADILNKIMRNCLSY